MGMFLEYLRPNDPLLMLGALGLALLLDHVYPEHGMILLKLHPVHLAYVMAKKLAERHPSKVGGVVVWFAIVSANVVPYALTLYVSWMISPILWVLVSAWTLKVSMSLRLLLDTVAGTARALEERNVDEARNIVQQIVRRNAEELDPEHIGSAAIESLAESSVDGFFSPLFYYMLLGPLGALVQRLANTLDGALGFLTPEYKLVGWFSAKIDTVLNYVPARLVALAMAFMSPIVGGGTLETLAVWRKYSGRTLSKNAGHPMSAVAGALGVRLEKPGEYILGEPVHDITPKKAMDGIKLAKTVSALLSLLVILMIYLTT